MKAVVFYAVLALLSSEVALAQVGRPVGFEEDGDPIYKAKDIEDAGAGTMLYTGTKAKPDEFPEVGWIQICTSTLIAPNVIFTAGHCKSTGSSVTFQHRESGKTFNGKCTRHPQYNNNTTYNDYAFCLLSESVPVGSHMASFDLSGIPVKGESLLANGMGDPQILNEYWGKAIVNSINGQDIVTCGPSNLGSGDSGGSLFRWETDLTKGKVRKIVGVNSRSSGRNGCSYFNKMGPEFVTFAKQFEIEKHVKLCGISVNCETPVEPVDCQLVYEELELCFDKAPAPMPSPLEKTMEKAESCLDKYKKFEQCILK